MARLIAALLVAALGSAAAFAPSSLGKGTPRVDTALSAEQDSGKKFAAAAVASAYLLSGLVVGADAALADTSSSPSFGGDSSTVLLSARSGGRAGGRAGGGGVSGRTGGAAGGAYRGAARSSTTTQSTTIVRPTTVIQSSPAVVAPVGVGGYGYGGYGGYGYGYNPYPGLGLSLGINAIGAVGTGIREARQEGEIARSQAELGALKSKEADMEARLRMMEQQQMMNQQAMNQQQMMQMMQK